MYSPNKNSPITFLDQFANFNARQNNRLYGIQHCQSSTWYDLMWSITLKLFANVCMYTHAAQPEYTQFVYTVAGSICKPATCVLNLRHQRNKLERKIPLTCATLHQRKTVRPDSWLCSFISLSFNNFLWILWMKIGTKQWKHFHLVCSFVLHNVSYTAGNLQQQSNTYNTWTCYSCPPLLMP